MRHMIDTNVTGTVYLLQRVLGEMVAVPDPRQHQKLRRVDRTGRQDHLVLCAEHVDAARVPDLDADRAPVLEHHERRDHVGSLDVRDVDAFDSQGCLVESERFLQFGQGGRPGGEIACTPELVLGERLTSIALDGLEECALVAALRHAQTDLRPAQPRQPRGELLLVWRQLRDQYFSRDRLAAVEIVLPTVELGEELRDLLGG